MQCQYAALLLAIIFVTVGCAGKAKSRPAPGSLEAAIEDCRRQQTSHYQNFVIQSDQNDQDEIIPNRVLEGIPHFDYQECMQRHLERREAV